MNKEKLSNLYDIGSSKRVFQSEWRDAGVPFYRTREIAKLSTDGYVDNELFIDEDLYDEYVGKYGKPQAGDVMVTGVGTLGICYVVKPDDKFYFKDGNILWFKQKAPNRILPEYLVKAFDSKEVKDFIAKNSSGTTVGTFTIQTANKMEITLPPLEMQKEVIKRITILEKIIKRRKDELVLFDNLIKARFVELFGDPITNEKGWDVAELTSVCDGIGDGLHGTPEYDEDGAYPFINGNNLMNGVIEITPATKMVNEETYKKHYIELTDNAILLSINGTLGKLAFYNGEEVMLGKSACYCNLKPEISREFVYGVMKTDAFSRFLEDNATASTIKNVGLKAIRGFKLILPPEELQIQFVNFAKHVDKSKDVVQKALDETQMLFDSLIQQYFG